MDSIMTKETFQTIAGMLGTVLEWYDFACYGFFSDIIGQNFFPPGETEDDNLVASYAVFGGAFLVRPIGGLITGHIGDKYGRKRAVVFSMLSMSVPTVLMGCLPTYSMIGWWSTALLVLCRLVQGFSVGGQLPSSVVYTIETKPKEHSGYYAAVVSFGSALGITLGNLVAAIIRHFCTDEQLVSWGWRLPFYSGILVAGVALLLDIHGDEHNPNAAEYSDDIAGNDDELELEVADRSSHPTTVSQTDSSPIKEAFKRENMPALVGAMLVPLLAGLGWYLTFIWIPIYMETLLDPPIRGAFWINLIASWIGNTVPSIATGGLSDKWGRSELMFVGIVLTAILGPVFMWIISWGYAVQAFFAQMALGLVLSLYQGPLFAWLPESFPPKTRLTSAALGYNIGICLSSGFTPMIATAMVQHFGKVSPGVLYPIFAVLTLVGMLITKMKYGGSSIDATESGVTPILGQQKREDEFEPNNKEAGMTSPLLN